MNRFSVIWSDIPANSSTVRGTVRSMLSCHTTSAATSLPFHFYIAFFRQNGVLPHDQISDRRLINLFGHSLIHMCVPGLRNRYYDSLRDGRSGDRIPVGTKFSAAVKTGPGAHPAGSLSRGQSSRGVALTTHSQLVP